MPDHFALKAQTLVANGAFQLLIIFASCPDNSFTLGLRTVPHERVTLKLPLLCKHFKSFKKIGLVAE